MFEKFLSHCVTGSQKMKSSFFIVGCSSCLLQMYTSGWPKNQNKFWYKIGLPHMTGSVRDSTSNRAVIATDHTNKRYSVERVGIYCKDWADARWKLKIAKLTNAPLWVILAEKGGRRCTLSLSHLVVVSSEAESVRMVAIKIFNFLFELRLYLLLQRSHPVLHCFNFFNLRYST